MSAALNSNQDETLGKSRKTYDLANLMILGLNQIMNIHSAS